MVNQRYIRQITEGGHMRNFEKKAAVVRWNLKVLFFCSLVVFGLCLILQAVAAAAF